MTLNRIIGLLRAEDKPNEIIDKPKSVRENPKLKEVRHLLREIAEPRKSETSKRVAQNHGKLKPEIYRGEPIESLLGIEKQPFEYRQSATRRKEDS
jgi:hypothetical protein